ncbi:hypothetical protein RZ76_13830 [Apilactobacillus kunkeei]|uniref:SIR2 family protein n=1 Tax=Apilactobacillus kunkeei TaxID=148814 RepID=UPI0006CEA142|nr:SIR2 family protein [Apilactobacillus kunkeei]KPN83315.1 hypothetical protein RZ76_13830 [Apilactobacillus kunkeei]
MSEDDFNRFNDSEEYDEAIKNISESMDKGKLVFFIGAGVSKIQGYAGWNGYIDRLFCYWIKKASHKGAKEIKDALQKIKNSKMDNTRKVDLLYEILEDLLSKEEFNKRKTEFEKYYFAIKEPDEKYNDVLLQLSELDATYLTTNYDNQIEKHLKLMKNKFYLVKDMSDFNNKINDDIFVNTVVHIHGTPYGLIDDFISSGESYKEHYYVANQITDNVREWLEKQNVTFVFIGSSMEEGEVLSLIPNNSKNIAILKTDDDKNSDYLRRIKGKFFSDKNNTTVLWYGSDYDELPLFIEKLKDDVLSRVKKTNEYILINELRNPRISSERMVELINTQKISTINKAIPGLVEENKNKILQNVTKINLLDDKKTNLPEQFFDVFLDGIDGLNGKQINRIARYISYNNGSYRYRNANLFFDRCSLDEIELDKIYKILSSRNDIEFTSFKQNSSVMGWKIVKDIIKKDADSYYSEGTDFNLSVPAVRNLVNYILKPEIIEETKCIGGETLIADNREFQGLYQAMLHNKLSIENMPWKDNIDDKIFESSVFIKLLMVIYKKQGFDIILIKKIIKNANFHDEYLGSYFGDFVRDNLELIKTLEIDLPKIEYVDNIQILGSSPITFKSIINKEELKKNNISILINKITDSKYECGNPPIKDKSNHTINVDKTIVFFEKVLNSNDNEQIEKVFKLMTYNCGEKNMFKMYKYLYEWILTKYKKSYSKDKLFGFICSNYQNINNFQPTDYNIFSTMIKEGTDNIIDQYLNIDVSNLNKPSVDFNIFSFMKFDLGSYLLLFNDILRRNDCYTDIIKIKIEDIDDKRIQHFMMGRHHEIFKDYQFNDLYFLIGFSSKNKINDNYTPKFVNAVKTFFNNRDNTNIDEFTLDNLLYIALQEIKPKDELLIKDDIAFKAFQILISNDNAFEYEEDWIMRTYKLNPNKFIQKILFYSSTRKNINKILKIIAQIEGYISLHGIPKINPIFYTKLLNLPEELTKELGSLLFMCANEYNIRDYSMQIIEFTLTNISVEERRKLIFNLEPHITKQKYDDLVSSYIHV